MERLSEEHTVTSSPAGNLVTNQTSSTDQWLYNCHHTNGDYLCFPPYCAPGGLRQLFLDTNQSRSSDKLQQDLESHQDSITDHKAEVKRGNLQSSTDKYNSFDSPSDPSPSFENSPSNPLELLLNSSTPHLPQYIQQKILDTQQDWNTLGGSRCSYEKHRLVIERQRHLRELQRVGVNKVSADDTTPEQAERQSTTGSILNSLQTVGLAAHRFGLYTLQSSRALEGYIDSTLQQFKFFEGIESKSNITSCSSPSIVDHRTSLSNSSSHNIHSNMAPAQQDDFPSIQSTSPSTTNTPLPEAVLVYHESAHSIVFRDHLRRQLTAIRRTTTDMETSLHTTDHPTLTNADTSSKGILENNNRSSTHSETTSIDLSERGYKPSDSSEGYESAGSRESYGSLDPSGGTRRKEKVVKDTTTHANKSASVAVANFQPVIEPLERLELNAMDVFGPLLDADPLIDLEGGGGLGLTDTEIEGMNIV